MNNQEFKLSFNYPLKEIYPEFHLMKLNIIIKNQRCQKLIIKTKPIPNDVFSKYYTVYLNKNNSISNLQGCK